MKRAVIMSRVSSDEQAKGFSLGVQYEQLTNYCKRKDIEVVAHYKEDHSAKNFNRPEFQNFLRFAKKNKNTIDYLLVTTWDRFSRNVTDSFVMIRRLRAMGIEVQAIEQPIDFKVPESKAMLALNLVLPEIDNDRRSVTLVHKGNIMKYTEGAFRDWGYELAKSAYNGEDLDGGPWQVIKNPKNGKNIVIQDVICDAFLQQILLRPKDYDVIATMNLNGDYISDALAACVGGIGIAPGANLSDEYAVFEATHGTAPKYAGQDKVNPGSLILSAEMMLRHMGWTEAADLIISSMEKTILAKKVTYDFERMMDGADLVSCSGFGEEMVKRM